MLRLQISYTGKWYDLQGDNIQQVREDMMNELKLDSMTYKNGMVCRDDHPSLHKWLERNHYKHNYIMFTNHPDVVEAPFNEKKSLQKFKHKLRAITEGAGPVAYEKGKARYQQYKDKCGYSAEWDSLSETAKGMWADLAVREELDEANEGYSG